MPCEDGCGSSWTRKERKCFSKSGQQASDQDCANAGLNKAGDKYLETLGACASYSQCAYAITSIQCSKKCGEGVKELGRFDCIDTKTNVVKAGADCKTASVPAPSIPPDQPCKGIQCEGEACELGECKWVDQGGFKECSQCEGVLERDISCQTKEDVTIDDTKCQNLQKPYYGGKVIKCVNSRLCENAPNWCCSGQTPKFDPLFPCLREDEVPLTKEECPGWQELSLEGLDCRDPGVVVCGSSEEFNTTLPIVASVISLVVVGGIIGGVYLFLWNRKRLNKKAQEDVATPFTVIRSDEGAY